MRHQRASRDGRALRIGGGGRGREHVVSLGCTTRAGKGSGALIHGHCAPSTPGSPHWCGPNSWGTGVLPKWWSLLEERLRGTATPFGAVPPARGTGNPAQLVVAAQRAPSHQRSATSWLGRVPCPGGGRCVKSTCRGWQPPSVRSHRRPGGLGVSPKRWSLPRERVWGMATAIGTVPPARGTGSPA